MSDRHPHEIHDCGNEIGEYPRHKCQDWPAHTLQPEHAEHRGWSCYICNGPCSKPLVDLPRCKHRHVRYATLCDLHENHRQEKHRTLVEWTSDFSA